RGRITIDGKDLTGATPRRVAAAGVGHIPEDRVGVGLVRSVSVQNNAILREYRSPALSTPVSLKKRAIVEFARDLIRRARVQTRSLESPAGLLSGGNQQRLVAHREAM